MNAVPLDTALTLVVPTSASSLLTSSELDKQMALYDIANTAKNYFVNGELSFSEYIEICEGCGVEIDSYLKTVEHNLKYLGLT